MIDKVEVSKSAKADIHDADKNKDVDVDVTKTEKSTVREVIPAPGSPPPATEKTTETTRVEHPQK